MPSSTVNTSADFKSFAGANRAFNNASQTAQRAGSIKICNNTYLIRESDCKHGQDIADAPVTSYALAFHGSKIVRYYVDGSFELNTHGYNTATTRHRLNQFTPFKFGNVKGELQMNQPSDYHATGETFDWSNPIAFVDGMRVSVSIAGIKGASKRNKPVTL